MLCLNTMPIPVCILRCHVCSVVQACRRKVAAPPLALVCSLICTDFLSLQTAQTFTLPPRVALARDRSWGRRHPTPPPAPPDPDHKSTETEPPTAPPEPAQVLSIEPGPRLASSIVADTPLSSVPGNDEEAVGETSQKKVIAKSNPGLTSTHDNILMRPPYRHFSPLAASFDEICRSGH